MATRRILLGAAGAALLTPLLSTATAGSASAAGGAATGSTSGRSAIRAGRRSGQPLQLRFPRPTGPFPVGTTELHLVDQDRDDPYVPGRPRELMISIWYPSRGAHAEPAPYFPPLTAGLYAEDAAEQLQQPVDAIDWVGAKNHAGLLAPVSSSWGRRPVVLFSPGAGVPHGLGSILVAELASRGYAVVTIDHTYEAAGVEFPGGRLELQKLPDGDIFQLVRRVRIADFQLVLDSIAVLAAGGNPDAGRRRLPAGLGQILDLTRIGSFGHSAGGISSADVMDVDRRVKAGINMDGTLGGGYPAGTNAPVVDHGLDRPFLLLGAGGTGQDGGPQTHRTETSWGLFWDNSTGWKRDLNVPDGMHYTFTDHQALIPWFDRFIDVPPELTARSIGSVDPDSILRSLRTYIPAFFDQHLRDRPSDKLWRGDSPNHPAIRFIA